MPVVAVVDAGVDVGRESCVAINPVGAREHHERRRRTARKSVGDAMGLHGGCSP